MELLLPPAYLSTPFTLGAAQQSKRKAADGHCGRLRGRSEVVDRTPQQVAPLDSCRCVKSVCAAGQLVLWRLLLVWQGRDDCRRRACSAHSSLVLEQVSCQSP